MIHRGAQRRIQKSLVEKWCLATVGDAVVMFHKARVHPDNEHVPLEVVARRCANSAFQYVAVTIVGDKDATARRYHELCIARFKREIEKVILEQSESEEAEELIC